MKPSASRRMGVSSQCAAPTAVLCNPTPLVWSSPVDNLCFPAHSLNAPGKWSLEILLPCVKLNAIFLS